MVQRSSKQLLAMMFGVLSLSAGCEPAGQIEESDLSDDIVNEADNSESTLPIERNAPVLGVISRDAGGSSAADAGVTAPAPTQADAAVPAPTSPTSSADAAVPAQPTQPAGAVSKVLRSEGNRILDTCGQPFVARGIEQLTAKAFSRDGTYATLAAELIKTGSNAVRLLPTDRVELTPAELDKLLTAFAAARVVVYISPYDRTWFARADIKPILLKHEKGLILDAFQEPDYNDVTRWRRETREAVAQLRAAGYTCPITVLANHYGRDLKAGLTYGQEIVDSDSAHNTIIGWQAYWGKSGYYQAANNMSLAQGVEACAKAKFPMQVGIDLNADANDEMDYPAVMAAAQTHGIGWLWWNFWNQWDGWNNNASTDGNADHLTPAGQRVIHSDPNSIEKTSKKACFR